MNGQFQLLKTAHMGGRFIKKIGIRGIGKGFFFQFQQRIIIHQTFSLQGEQLF
jgi:hypothetical protein